MSDILDFNTGSESNSSFWNYGKPEKDDFSLSITGEVVEIRKVQSKVFGTKQPAFYDDGNPKMEIWVVLKTADGGEVAWANIRPKSNAMHAFQRALESAGKPGKNLIEVGGLIITAETQQPPQGFTYGQKNPRPFRVKILGPGDSGFRGVVDTMNGKAKQQPKPQPSAVNYAAQQAAAAWGQPQQSTYADEDIPW